jgi:putative addiction module component (TIGR02574 family)
LALAADLACAVSRRRVCFVVMGDSDQGFEGMTPAERILHVQDLWDRIAGHPENVPVTEAQKEELERRLAAHDADPGSSLSWEEVQGRLRLQK